MCINHEVLLFTKEWKWEHVKAGIIVSDLPDECLADCQGCILPRKLRMIQE